MRRDTPLPKLHIPGSRHVTPGMPEITPHHPTSSTRVGPGRARRAEKAEISGGQRRPNDRGLEGCGGTPPTQAPHTRIPPRCPRNARDPSTYQLSPLAHPHHPTECPTQQLTHFVSLEKARDVSTCRYTRRCRSRKDSILSCSEDQNSQRESVACGKGEWPMLADASGSCLTLGSTSSR